MDFLSRRIPLNPLSDILVIKIDPCFLQKEEVTMERHIHLRKDDTKCNGS